MLKMGGILLLTHFDLTSISTMTYKWGTEPQNVFPDSMGGTECDTIPFFSGQLHVRSAGNPEQSESLGGAG